MPRPQLIVTVSEALPRRGSPTQTGRAFMVFAGATGPAAPVRCTSPEAALAASVPAGVAAWVGDALEQGAPEVIVVRATAVDAEAVTEAEWKAGLAKLTNDYGPGQVLIPGVATSAAYAALLDHAATKPTRVVLLDTAAAAVAATVAAAASGLTAAGGAKRAAMITPWATVPAVGGTTRDVPGSVVAAGLAARGDSAVGHANHAAIFEQGRDAGVVLRSAAVTAAFTDAQADTLYDAGVNAIRIVNGRATLTGWRAITDDGLYKQLNVGRFATQLVAGLSDTVFKYLGRQIDGRGLLFSEIGGAIRGYLLPLWSSAALYGETADDAFDVECSNDNNPPENISTGQIHAAVQMAVTPHTERLTIDVVTAIAEGAAA